MPDSLSTPSKGSTRGQKSRSTSGASSLSHTPSMTAAQRRKYTPVDEKENDKLIEEMNSKLTAMKMNAEDELKAMETSIHPEDPLNPAFVVEPTLPASPRLRFEMDAQSIKRIDYRFDGDSAMENEDMKRIRKSLRAHPGIQKWIVVFWKTYKREIITIPYVVNPSYTFAPTFNKAIQEPFSGPNESIDTDESTNAPMPDALEPPLPFLSDVQMGSGSLAFAPFSPPPTAPSHPPTMEIEAISKEEYMKVHALMYKALHTQYNVQHSQAAATRDWTRDIWLSTSSQYLDFPAFFHSMFELVDLWTLTVDADEYLHLLSVLFHRITRISSWLTYEGAVVSKYVWRKLKHVNSSAVYRPYLYSKYENVRWKKWEEVRKESDEDSDQIESEGDDSSWQIGENDVPDAGMEDPNIIGEGSENEDSGSSNDEKYDTETESALNSLQSHNLGESSITFDWNLDIENDPVDLAIDSDKKLSKESQDPLAPITKIVVPFSPSSMKKALSIDIHTPRNLEPAPFTKSFPLSPGGRCHTAADIFGSARGPSLSARILNSSRGTDGATNANVPPIPESTTNSLLVPPRRAGSIEMELPSAPLTPPPVEMILSSRKPASMNADEDDDDDDDSIGSESLSDFLADDASNPDKIALTKLRKSQDKLEQVARQLQQKKEEREQMMLQSVKTMVDSENGINIKKKTEKNQPTPEEMARAVRLLEDLGLSPTNKLTQRTAHNLAVAALQIIRCSEESKKDRTNGPQSLDLAAKTAIAKKELELMIQELQRNFKSSEKIKVAKQKNRKNAKDIKERSPVERLDENLDHLDEYMDEILEDQRKEVSKQKPKSKSGPRSFANVPQSERIRTPLIKEKPGKQKPTKSEKGLSGDERKKLISPSRGGLEKPKSPKSKTPQTASMHSPNSSMEVMESPQSPPKKITTAEIASKPKPELSSENKEKVATLEAEKSVHSTSSGKRTVQHQAIKSTASSAATVTNASKEAPLTQPASSQPHSLEKTKSSAQQKGGWGNGERKLHDKVGEGGEMRSSNRFTNLVMRRPQKQAGRRHFQSDNDRDRAAPSGGETSEVHKSSKNSTHAKPTTASTISSPSTKAKADRTPAVHANGVKKDTSKKYGRSPKSTMYDGAIELESNRDGNTNEENLEQPRIQYAEASYDVIHDDVHSDGSVDVDVDAESVVMDDTGAEELVSGSERMNLEEDTDYMTNPEEHIHNPNENIMESEEMPLDQVSSERTIILEDETATTTDVPTETGDPFAESGTGSADGVARSPQDDPSEISTIIASSRPQCDDSQTFTNATITSSFTSRNHSNSSNASVAASTTNSTTTSRASSASVQNVHPLDLDFAIQSESSVVNPPQELSQISEIQNPDGENTSVNPEETSEKKHPSTQRQLAREERLKKKLLAQAEHKQELRELSDLHRAMQIKHESISYEQRWQQRAADDARQQAIAREASLRRRNEEEMQKRWEERRNELLEKERIQVEKERIRQERIRQHTEHRKKEREERRVAVGIRRKTRVFMMQQMLGMQEPNEAEEVPVHRSMVSSAPLILSGEGCSNGISEDHNLKSSSAPILYSSDDLMLGMKYPPEINSPNSIQPPISLTAKALITSRRHHLPKLSNLRKLPNQQLQQTTSDIGSSNSQPQYYPHLLDDESHGELNGFPLQSVHIRSYQLGASHKVNFDGSIIPASDFVLDSMLPQTSNELHEWQVLAASPLHGRHVDKLHNYTEPKPITTKQNHSAVKPIMIIPSSTAEIPSHGKSGPIRSNPPPIPAHSVPGTRSYSMHDISSKYHTRIKDPLEEKEEYDFDLHNSLSSDSFLVLKQLTKAPMGISHSESSLPLVFPAISTSTTTEGIGAHTRANQRRLYNLEREKERLALAQEIKRQRRLMKEDEYGERKQKWLEQWKERERRQFFILAQRLKEKEEARQRKREENARKVAEHAKKVAELTLEARNGRKHDLETRRERESQRRDERRRRQEEKILTLFMKRMNTVPQYLHTARYSTLPSPRLPNPHNEHMNFSRILHTHRKSAPLSRVPSPPTLPSLVGVRVKQP